MTTAGQGAGVYSVVDVAGINRLLVLILASAAGAIVGMVQAEPPSGEKRPVLVASMFATPHRWSIRRGKPWRTRATRSWPSAQPVSAGRR